MPEAQNYIDLGLDPLASDFAERVLEAMRNATAIHFNLTKMVMLGGPDGVLSGPREQNPLGSTNWELRTLWDSPELRRKTTFWRDQQLIAEEEVARLP